MRRVFFSFDWDDVWRVNQVRNSWVAKGNYQCAGFVDAADIESVKRHTDQTIKNWIVQQLEGTSVTCVLIGSNTANSRWVDYEIQKSVDKKNGLLGVYIHKVRDQHGQITAKGIDPFATCAGPENLNYPCCSCYDWVDESGYEKLGYWIERAAQQANR